MVRNLRLSKINRLNNLSASLTFVAMPKSCHLMTRMLFYTVLGDPTEACLNVLAEKAGITLENNNRWAPRLKELPFDSVRKRMTTINRIDSLIDSSSLVSITKGAPKRK